MPLSVPAWARRPRTWRLAFLVAALGALAWAGATRPMLAGDAIEYHATLQALVGHGTPEVRSTDLFRLGTLFEAAGLCSASCAQEAGTVSAVAGKRFTAHFWAYPLSAVPARFVLHRLGGRECSSFQITNVLMALLALYAALFLSAAAWPRRLAFCALSALSPVLWYLTWPSAEVFTWSCVVAAIALAERRSFALAALCASVGAMQNPPVVFLAGLLVLRSLEERNPRRTAAAFACACVSQVPAAFDLWKFHSPSLLASLGAADVHLISAHRFWSLVGDLNQGMLPYVPGLVLLGSLGAALALVEAVRLRRWQPPMLVATIVVMILSCCVAPNWNAGAATMQRYAVWMVPLFAWLAVLHPPPRWHGAIWAGAIALQAAIAFSGSRQMFYLDHTPLARTVLRRAPFLYDPEPEIFVERLLHTERWSSPLLLPLAFTDGDRVTKVLVDPASVLRLPTHFRVAGAWFEGALRRHASESGLFYLNPPAGAVTVEPVDETAVP